MAALKVRGVSSVTMALVLISLVAVAAFQPFVQVLVLERLNPPVEVRRLRVSGGLSIDLLGGLVPGVAGCAVLFYFLWRRVLGFRGFLSGFLVSLFLVVVLSSVTPGAVVVKYVVSTCLVTCSTFVTLSLDGGWFYLLNMMRSKALRDQRYVRDVRLGRFLLLNYAFVTLSHLLVDFLYLPYSGFEMYVGGGGLVDAIFLSGVLGFPMMVLMFSCDRIVRQVLKGLEPRH